MKVLEYDQVLKEEIEMPKMKVEVPKMEVAAQVCLEQMSWVLGSMDRENGS